jgi:hypothetical protein
MARSTQLHWNNLQFPEFPVARGSSGEFVSECHEYHLQQQQLLNFTTQKVYTQNIPHPYCLSHQPPASVWYCFFFVSQLLPPGPRLTRSPKSWMMPILP